ncbi:MAG: hypothetical protein KDC12_08960 [Flavobacteriales bacterium]|nr:hypothetical protein [Flavobacteriales bacterium]
MVNVEIGTVCELEVREMEGRTPLLAFGEETLELPAIDSPFGVKVGDVLSVFLFYDDQGEIAATTQIPFVLLNEIAAVTVNSATSTGAFAEIGTRRDIFIPTREQMEPMKRGRRYVIMLKHDAEGRRLYGTSRILPLLQTRDIPLERGDEIDGLIFHRFREGYKVVVNDKYAGVVLRNEMLKNLRVGDRFKGYVRKVEFNNLLLSTQKEGMELLEESKQHILNFLEQHGGYVRLTDDSDPEEIKIRLRMSKKTFKKAVGMLYKDGKIAITRRGIKLLKEGAPIPPLPHGKVWEVDKPNDKPTSRSSTGGQRSRRPEHASTYSRNGKPGDKPSGKPGGRPSGRPGGKPGGKMSGRPGGKPGEKPAGKFSRSTRTERDGEAKKGEKRVMKSIKDVRNNRPNRRS